MKKREFARGGKPAGRMSDGHPKPRDPNTKKMV
ncbi:MAG: hypothetical protein RL077_2146 [Verrucomicrobiota bacterium]|jgi:hypothetical protein